MFSFVLADRPALYVKNHQNSNAGFGCRWHWHEGANFNAKKPRKDRSQLIFLGRCLGTDSRTTDHYRVQEREELRASNSSSNNSFPPQLVSLQPHAHTHAQVYRDDDGSEL